MAPIIVQINFKLNMSGKEYEQAIAPLAQAIADVEGLYWNIWLLNKYSHEAGGIYLFKDEDSANAFLCGPLVAQVKSAPSIDDLRVAHFSVLSTLTAITRGPVTKELPGTGEA
jgi:hypothetical protein